MRKTRVLSAVAVAAIAGLVVSACGSGGDDKAGGNTDGTLHVDLGEPKSLIPPNVGETEGGEIVRYVYSGLYSYGNDGALVPVIADGQPTSTDNKVWTIKLKEGFTFHNGEKIDANLFKKSWDFAVDGRNANNGSYFFNGVEGFGDTQVELDAEGAPKAGAKPKAEELSGVKAVDANTIQITLAKAWVGFPTMLGYTAFYPTAEECRANLEACNVSPIGNGAFKVEGKWEHDKAIKLVRWDDYKGEKPFVKTLDYKIYSGGSNSWNDFEAGTVDISTPTSDSYLAAKEKYGSKMIEAPSPSTWSLGFPVYDDVFKNVKIRQAFSQAIDRKAIIDAIFLGQGKVLTSFTPEMIPGYKADTCTFCKTDIAAAKATIDAEWPKGKKVELWINSGSTGEKILKAIGDQITKNLGLEYELKLLEWPQFLDKKQKHQLTGPYFTGWSPDWPLLDNYMGPLYKSVKKDGSDNDFGYYSAAFQDLFDQGDAATTMPEAIAKYQAAEAVLGTELPVAPLFTRMTSTVIGENVDFDSIDRNPILGGIDYTKIKLA